MQITTLKNRGYARYSELSLHQPITFLKSGYKEGVRQSVIKINDGSVWTLQPNGEYILTNEKENGKHNNIKGDAGEGIQHIPEGYVSKEHYSG